VATEFNFCGFWDPFVEDLLIAGDDSISAFLSKFKAQEMFLGEFKVGNNFSSGFITLSLFVFFFI